MIRKCKENSHSRIAVTLFKFLLLTILSTSGSSFSNEFHATHFKHYRNHGWKGEYSTTIFSCDGYDSSDKVFIYGNEISFRASSAQDSEAACRSWINVATDLLNNKNIENIEWRKENSLIKIGAGRYKERYPIFLSQANLPNNEFAGRFQVNSVTYFSEGVYVSPLTSKPKTGKRSYVGHTNLCLDMSYQKFLDIDFSKNTISIDLGIPMPNSSTYLRTISPLSFNPANGDFSGEVELSSLGNWNGAVLEKIKYAISGSVGGRAGTIVVAVLHNGYKTGNISKTDSQFVNDRLLNGFEYFIAVAK
jgi:hypothetical protein